MNTNKNLYPKILSKKNLYLAFKKAKKNKSKKIYIINFEKNLKQEIEKLHHELKNQTYAPRKLKKFTIRDPKTRTIHSSNFRDRVIHHAIVNVLEPIYEKIFISDSYANRINKGTHKAIKKFDKFKNKTSNNLLVKNSYTKNQIKGYVLKADIEKYFNTVDHEILLKIIKRKIKDKKTIWLIKQILNNFDTKTKNKGMPLGNLTSQFFANIYLNELDYFIKHKLKIKYYIRYVDDFIIFHKNKEILKEYKNKISKYIKIIRLNLHKDKTNIKPLKNGITFLGYRIYGKYKLLRKNNLRTFYKTLNNKQNKLETLQGWFGYAKKADTYNLRNKLLKQITTTSLQ